jgi:hypothetical protein
VDGFDQDKHTSQGDEGCEVAGGFLAPHRDPFEPLQLANQLLNPGPQPV